MHYLYSSNIYGIISVQIINTYSSLIPVLLSVLQNSFCAKFHAFWWNSNYVGAQKANWIGNAQFYPIPHFIGNKCNKKKVGRKDLREEREKLLNDLYWVSCQSTELKKAARWQRYRRPKFCLYWKFSTRFRENHYVLYPSGANKTSTKCESLWIY